MGRGHVGVHRVTALGLINWRLFGLKASKTRKMVGESDACNAGPGYPLYLERWSGFYMLNRTLYGCACQETIPQLSCHW